MKKLCIGSIGLLLISISGNIYASLASDAVLLFDPSIEGCPSGGTPPNCDLGLAPVIVGGTFFSFDIDGNNNIELWERFGMVAQDGIKIGTAQPASGSHDGPPDGSELFSIDQPWQFFGNTGMHLSTSPVLIASDDNAGNVLLDMSGWAITWNNIDITFGSGSWGSNPESQAILTCSSDCATGDTFTLYYTASVPNGDPSGFGDVRYRLGFDGGLASSLLLTASAEVVGFSDDDPGLVLSGVIGSSSAVPVPAAVWLFGSGLLGLIGLARRKA